MTVPTNNEEAEALVSIMRAANSSEGGVVLRYGDAARAILAAGFRRLPVSGDNTEAAWNEFRDSPDYTPTDRYPASDVFRAGYAAALSAPQPREAAPSDSDREALIAEARSVLTRAMNRSEDRAPGEDRSSWYAKALVDAGLLAPAEPIQVEVTDDMVERAAKHLAEAVADWTDFETGEHTHDLDCTNWTAYLGDARTLLLAALGGGE